MRHMRIAAALFLSGLLAAAPSFFTGQARAEESAHVVPGGLILGVTAPTEHAAPTLTWRGVARPGLIDPLAPLPGAADFSLGSGWTGANIAGAPHRNALAPLTSWVDVDDLQLAMTGGSGATLLGTNFSANWFGLDWQARAATVVPGLPAIGDPAATWFRSPDLKLRLMRPF